MCISKGAQRYVMTVNSSYSQYTSRQQIMVKKEKYKFA